MNRGTSQGETGDNVINYITTRELITITTGADVIILSRRNSQLYATPPLRRKPHSLQLLITSICRTQQCDSSRDTKPSLGTNRTLINE